MTMATRILANIFGVATMFLLLYGTVMVLKGSRFEIQEITFLMFACFIVTVMAGFVRKTERD